MKKMTVADVWNKVNELQKGMETSAKAMALGMSTDKTPQYVVNNLLKDYKRYSNEYYEFMKQEVEIVDENRKYHIVLQLTYDGSFLRYTGINSQDGEVIIQATNNMKWAKKYKNEDMKELEGDIANLESEGYDVRMIKVVSKDE
ncbi:hypothetical protein [Bacillus phage vB_BanS-Thrax2]|nr:hypothetical protein [Bacillus phage vB_BanS-Thrax2]